MAAHGREEYLQALTAEFCSCGLCGQVVNCPRVLPCFHTFCGSCLEEYIVSQVGSSGQVLTFACPVCDRATALPQGLGKQPYYSGFKSDTFIAKLSEVIHAFKEGKPCDICRRRDVRQAASNWCMDCFDAVCENCTKIHLCGKTTTAHVIISLEELRKLSLDNIMKRTTLHTCLKHSEDLVKLYCLDCREPVCLQCLTSDHRKCDDCVPLREAMNTLESDVAEVMTRVRNTTSDVTTNGDVSAYESGADVLENSVEKAEAAIRSLADDLRRRVDESEQALLERLHAVGSQLHDKVGDFRNAPGSREDDVRVLTAAGARMDALLKYGSDVEILDVYNVIRETLARLEGLNTSVSSTSTNQTDDEVRLKVNFDVAEQVKLFCRDFAGLGEIRVEDCNSDDGLSSWGVAVTSQDDIIVVDCRNKRVQKFASSGDLIDHIQISDEPRDVTSCGDGSNDVAITIMKKQIFLVTVADSKAMSLKKKIATAKQYDGISYSQSGNTFLVTSLDSNCVDIISAQGDVMQSFSSDEAGEGGWALRSPRYVTCTKENHLVVSDEVTNCVTCVSKDGGVLFSYKPEGSHEIKKSQGVFGDRIGNLFIADYANSRVHLLTSTGTFQRFLLGRDSGLSRPVALAMSPNNKLVVVQSDGMVKVFSSETMKVKLKVTCWCPRCLDSSKAHSSDGNGDLTTSGDNINGGCGGANGAGGVNGAGVSNDAVGRSLRIELGRRNTIGYGSASGSCRAGGSGGGSGSTCSSSDNSASGSYGYTPHCRYGYTTRQNESSPLTRSPRNYRTRFN